MASVAKRKWTYKGVEKTAYVVRWKVGKTQPSKQFDKFKDADKFRQKVEREIEDGNHVLPKDSSTVEEIADNFIKLQEDRVHDGRIGYRWLESMNEALRLNIIPHFGARKAKDLNRQDIVQFYSVMTRKQGLAPFTAKCRIKILQTIMNYARQVGAVAHIDYFKDAMHDLRGVEHLTVRTFTVEEMHALVRVVSTTPAGRQDRPNLSMRCYTLLAGFCGLRYGEIGALALGDLDLDRGTIHVRHNLQRNDTLGPPKSKAGKRKVPVPSFVAAAVREWIDRYYIPNDRKLVFRQRDGGYQDNNCFRCGQWHVGLKRAGLFDDDNMFHFHALRHFAASWMIENGMNLADVARILGHSKFDMTLRTYTHSVMADDHQHAAIERGANRFMMLSAKPTIIAQEMRNAD